MTCMMRTIRPERKDKGKGGKRSDQIVQTFERDEIDGCEYPFCDSRRSDDT